MQKDTVYKIVIAVLVCIIFLQWLIISKPIPKPKRIPGKAAPVALRGKIAIVLDDWGYNLNNLSIIDQLKIPLTASVLPNLAYSSSVAKELHKRGFEVILHLPMEPHEKFHLEKNTIMVSSNAATIEKIIDKDLAGIPYVKGVSNHMGSSATENPKAMEAIFKELKKRNLYFLDSFVSPQTVCFGLAKKIGIGFAKRDVFLDNEEEPLYIKHQLEKLKNRAAVKGGAIGIGHDRRMTLEVLKEVMPQLEKEGYKFVFVSELVK